MPLRVTHEHLGPATLAYVEGGWEYILAKLKTMLETEAVLGRVGTPSTL